MSSTGPNAESLREHLVELMRSGDTDSLLQLVDQLAGERDELADEREQLASRVETQSAEITWLRRLLFGRRSEKLSSEELGQLVLAYGASEQDAAVEEPQLPVPAQDEGEVEEAERPGKTRRPNHRGRTKLSVELEREVTIVPVPEADKNCRCCGAEMVAFGHLDHERVEYVPAKFVVHVERRLKLGCRKCKQDAVIAPRQDVPDRALRVGASVLAHLIESKCDDALPIHRQCDQFARLGFELPTTTAYGYWRYATDLLLPISDALFGTVLEDPVWIGVDDTGIDVLDSKRDAGKYRGHLWCFRASSGLLAYQFTETWKAEEVAPWFQLIGDETFIQVDDYKGYSSLIELPNGHQAKVVPDDRRLGCMMHVRRRFYKAMQQRDKRAAIPVDLIKKIYKVEEVARGRPADERLALRQMHSLPLLDRFDAWVDASEHKLGKTGTLAKAVGYAKQQRVFIRRCFSDGRLEIDNGAVERAIREPALGRKNFLFTGSAPAAKRLAGAYSLVQTCRVLGISTRDYLVDVITKIEGGWPARRLTELLPQRWAEHRPE